MKKIIRPITTKRRGQMFILATMLIAVYVVTMSATILNIGTTQVSFNEQSLREPYTNLKRELQGFLEYELAQYTDNSSTFSQADAQLKLMTFLGTLEAVDSSRSILTSINLFPNSLIIDAKTNPVSNVSNGFTYSSLIQARFHLEMSDISSTIKIIEDFNISFKGYAEVNENVVIVKQSKSASLDLINANSVLVINGSSNLAGVPYSNKTGYFIFESLTSIHNIGILNVILPNGVHIYS
ncbi:MAG: hypothetical protein KAT16_00550 [Candidatus Heimdallarchaeota archaeon]|nr:hypothetical protein [Candidatus Heimdallarchaeota archaeon]